MKANQNSLFALYEFIPNVITRMIKIFTVDAFTGEMFSGNPEAVGHLEKESDYPVLKVITRSLRKQSDFVNLINKL